MVRRMAGCLALLSFAVCLIAGLNAGNTASTVLSNALAAMGVTFLVGLAVGAMAQKMLDENVSAAPAQAAVEATQPTGPGSGVKGKKEIPERIPEAKGR